MPAVPSNAAYFIWEGKNSKDYGLVMTSMPVITMPSTKYEAYETDYIDGAIVREFGLSTYELSFDIAFVNIVTSDTQMDIREKMTQFLYKRIANINEFDQSNKLIFSKDISSLTDEFYWYEAKLLDQIDFDYFYKYRTATLKFLIQPLARVGNYIGTSYLYYQKQTNSNVSTEQQIDCTIYCDNQFKVKRAPMIDITFNNPTSLTWLSNNDYFLYYLTGSIYNEQDIDNNYVCYTRGFAFKCATLKEIIDLYSNIAEVKLRINTLNNKYLLYIKYSSGSEYRYVVTDVSRALVLSNAYTIGSETAYDEIIKRDDQFYNLIDLNTPTNYSIPFRLGRSNASNYESMVVYVITNNASVSVSDFVNIDYYPMETIL